MADWTKLRAALHGVDRSVTYSFDELDELVGGLPRTASRDRGWWSGERTHVRMWRTAGFAATGLVLGEQVTFRRKQSRASDAAPAAPQWSTPLSVIAPGTPSLLLVAPFERHQSTPAKVRRLFLAECDDDSIDLMSRLPWYVITTERGLLAPGDSMPPPAQRLSDTPPDYQKAWAAWVVERLQLVHGTLAGHAIVVFGADEYIAALRVPLSAKGAHPVEMVPA